jgi:hypothetical protein
MLSELLALINQTDDIRVLSLASNRTLPSLQRITDKGMCIHVLLSNCLESAFKYETCPHFVVPEASWSRWLLVIKIDGKGDLDGRM